MMELELYKVVLDEIKEFHLSTYREQNREDYAQLNSEIITLRKRLDEIISRLTEPEAEVIDKYITKTSALADKDCSYLYVQGAIDCVKLLKKLGVI